MANNIVHIKKLTDMAFNFHYYAIYKEGDFETPLFILNDYAFEVLAAEIAKINKDNAALKKFNDRTETKK